MASWSHGVMDWTGTCSCTPFNSVPVHSLDHLSCHLSLSRPRGTLGQTQAVVAVFQVSPVTLFAPSSSAGLPALPVVPAVPTPSASHVPTPRCVAWRADHARWGQLRGPGLDSLLGRVYGPWAHGLCGHGLVTLSTARGTHE